MRLPGAPTARTPTPIPALAAPACGHFDGRGASEDGDHLDAGEDHLGVESEGPENR